MNGILHTLFEWPGGIVVGNLIASAMWAVPAFAHLHWIQARRHRQLLTGGTTSARAASSRQVLAAAPISPPPLTWDNPEAQRDRGR